MSSGSNGVQKNVYVRKDVDREVRKRARKAGGSYSGVLNEAARIGLARMRASDSRKR